MAKDSVTLRRRARLEARADSPDGGGGRVEGWIPLGEHWVAVLPASGREIYAESRQAQRITHRITLRCAPRGGTARPRADQRFRIGGALFDIRAVFDRDGRGRFLTCLCEEGAPS